MVERPIPRILSEAQLDEMLSELHPPTEPSRGQILAIKRSVFPGSNLPGTPHYGSSLEEGKTAAAPLAGHWTSDPARRRRGRKSLRATRTAQAICAITVAAALVAIALLVPSGFGGSGTGGVADAREVLEKAASQSLAPPDEASTAGPYIYVETREWNTGLISTDFVVQSETVTKEWIPQDPTNPALVWLTERQPTGNEVWLRGSRQEMEAAGLSTPADSAKPFTNRVACGGNGSANLCMAAGSWQNPTPSFVAALPRDTDELYRVLLKDIPDNGRGDAAVLTYACDLLRSGLVPTDLRSSIYHVLSRLQNVRVVASSTNLNGTVGTSIGIDDGVYLQEVIFDPTTGAFIGERQTLTSEMDPLGAGDVLSSSAVQTSTADVVGVVPR